MSGVIVIVQTGSGLQEPSLRVDGALVDQAAQLPTTVRAGRMSQPTPGRGS